MERLNQRMTVKGKRPSPPASDLAPRGASSASPKSQPEGREQPRSRDAGPPEAMPRPTGRGIEPPRAETDKPVVEQPDGGKPVAGKPVAGKLQPDRPRKLILRFDRLRTAAQRAKRMRVWRKRFKPRRLTTAERWELRKRRFGEADMPVIRVSGEFDTILVDDRYLAAVAAYKSWPGTCLVQGFTVRVGSDEQLAERLIDRWIRDIAPKLVWVDILREAPPFKNR
jgi:hypothetical protein